MIIIIASKTFNTYRNITEENAKLLFPNLTSFPQEVETTLSKTDISLALDIMDKHITNALQKGLTIENPEMYEKLPEFAHKKAITFFKGKRFELYTRQKEQREIAVNIGIHLFLTLAKDVDDTIIFISLDYNADCPTAKNVIIRPAITYINPLLLQKIDHSFFKFTPHTKAKEILPSTNPKLPKNYQIIGTLNGQVVLLNCLYGYVEIANKENLTNGIDETILVNFSIGAFFNCLEILEKDFAEGNTTASKLLEIEEKLFKEDLVAFYQNSFWTKIFFPSIANK